MNIQHNKQNTKETEMVKWNKQQKTKRDMLQTITIYLTCRRQYYLDDEWEMKGYDTIDASTGKVEGLFQQWRGGLGARSGSH